MRVVLWWYPIPNIGDILNPLMLPRIFPALLPMTTTEPVDRVLLGIGSVLGIRAQHKFNPSVPRIVWGSGFQYEAPRPLPEGSEFKCVRGFFTCERYGLNPTLGVADPAILMPFHWTRTVQATKETGRFIRWNAEVFTDPNTHQEIPLAPDTHTTRVEEAGLEGWLETLWSYRRVECDSLHAAILADAYGIPWKPLRWEPKWLDHFRQLGITQKPTDFVLSDRERLGIRAVQLMNIAAELNKVIT